MKKKILTSAAALIAAAAMLTGCGADKAYLSGIKASDYVNLPAYDAIEVEVAREEVSDEFVDFYVNYSLSANASYEVAEGKTEVEDGDTVNINYVGTMDGEAFDGGSADNQNLTIGSGRFIEGFESGLVGASVGDTVGLDLAFPDPYENNPDLAGKPVHFDVTINSILVWTTPELTDEYVAGLGISKVATVEDYKAYVKKMLVDQERSVYESDVQEAIRSYLMDNTTFRQDPPAEMVDRYVTSMVDYYRAYANQSYMPLDAFMQTYYPLDTGNEEEEEALEEAVEEAAEEIEEAAEAGEDAAEAGEEAASSDIEDTAEAGEEEAASSAEADEAAADSAEAEAAAPEYTNEMPEEYMEVLREQATETAKFFIILQAIADKEKLNVSNREFKTYLSTVAAGQGYTSLEDFKKENDTNEYKESMMADKVLEYLAGHAVVTEPAKEEAPAAAADDSAAEDAEAEADEASEEAAEDSEGAGE